MTKAQTKNIAIGSDAPLTDPAQDAFGYAPFARRIAEAVCKTPSPQGLVMAIHGSWGVGKSTLLNFIKHDLNQLRVDERPIVVDFNPWWFGSRDHLATQFLMQFRAKLPHESEILRSIGDKMADYGTAIGTTIAKVYGIPWLDKPIGFLLKLFKRVPKDVPALKTEIADALKRADQRFVFVVDDIDRLAPDEMRELFKVVKALADFPNVVYLLSFDRRLVADSLATSLGVDGDAYIEKIVQVPFSLPVVDRLRLRKKLFGELDRILESLPLPDFDQTYWGNVYFDGLDHYIRKPRDVVRIVNGLSVLYPAAAGEVNSVDFIAIEFLRVFEPEAYGAICTQKDMFAGYLSHRHREDLEPERAFHNAWLERVPKDRQPQVKQLMRHLFPRLEGIWGNMTYGADWAARWRRELRVCSPEIFDVYFQFGVSPDALRRAELDELLAVAAQPEKVTNILTFASTVKRPDGSSKAREYLERLRDMEEEITPEAASGLLTSLFDVGDVLLSPQDDLGGFTSIPNRWRLQWATSHLIKRVPENNRDDVLRRLISQGHALFLATQIVSNIDEYRSKQDGASDSPLAQVSEPVFSELKNIVVDRLNRLDDQQLLTMPELPYVIYRWIRWSNPESVAARLSPVLASDTYLPRFLEKYLRWGTRHGFGDRVARRVPHLNPKDIEVVSDVSALEPRVQEMLRRADLTPDQRTAGEQFLKSMERVRQGEDPDGFFMDD